MDPLLQVRGCPVHRSFGFPRRWLLLFPIVVLAVLLYCVDIRSVRLYREPSPGPLPQGPLSVPRGSPPPLELSSGFLVDTPGCRIPFLTPLDDSVRRFVYHQKAVNCSDAGPELVEAGDDVLRIRRDRAHAYNISDPDRLSCCARAFWRPLSARHDDTVEYAENCTYFAEELPVSDEFVRVDCYDEDMQVYKDYFGFTPEKPAAAVEDAAVNDVVDPDTPKVSVLLVGADSISRSNLLRQMPKTVQFLRELRAVDMQGYNKVEDNTFPNLMAVLTGLSVTELRTSCWPASSAPFDACPFIWQRFQSLGYRTAYGEDEPWMGIFNYIKSGFRRQPVDYYMRPYARLILKELGHHQEENCNLCAGPRLQLQVLLDYAARFARLPAPALLFGLFWGVSLSHDFLNMPQLADPLYESFLRRARDDGVLNKTVLIFLSDHGIRWGEIRETYQGRMEERLPFLMIAVPPWLRERYPTAVANLRRNARRLVTPYDLHRTLEDLLDLSQLEQGRLKERANQLRRMKHLPRALSMFTMAPDNRTCHDAGIEPHWCTCHSSRVMPTNDTAALRAALFVVRKVNELLRPFSQCAPLRLNAVLDARLEEGAAEGVGKARKALVRDYTLIVRTEPGGARLEGTVRHRVNLGAGGLGQASRFKLGANDNATLALAGTVSRVNKYGSQSACVADYRMKLYCYCRGFRGP